MSATEKPVHPTGEQLYTMVCSRMAGGTFPWVMVSPSGKAAWSAAAAELVFAPDTIMAKYGGTLSREEVRRQLGPTGKEKTR